MATNRSSNKTVVTKLFGGGGELGGMDPQNNMKVKHGQDTRWITASGSNTTAYPLGSGTDILVSLAMTSGGPQIARAYPYQLQIDVTVASGFGWPTAGGSVGIGHSGIWRNGVPNVMASGNQFNFMSGAGLGSSTR